MLARSRLAVRALSASARTLAKNDSSTIDSFRFPSQTSINEWEFKYDFMPKVAEPKIPPVSPEAVKQDIAQTKKQQVEADLRNREFNSSVKVEANDAHVVRGGEAVAAEPEYLHDRASDPVDVSAPGAGKPTKTLNTDKYVQLSINPEINNPSILNLGHDNEVDHKTATHDTSPVVDDVEHAETAEKEPQPSSSVSPAAILGVLGLGGLAGYFLFGKDKTKAKAKAA